MIFVRENVLAGPKWPQKRVNLHRALFVAADLETQKPSTRPQKIQIGDS